MSVFRGVSWAMLGLSLLAATAEAQTTFVDTFESGGSAGGWSFGGPFDSIAASGGNPGRFLQTIDLDTFAPQPRTQRGLDSQFTGDFAARGVRSIGVDLITTRVDFSAAGRPLSLLLIEDNDTPFDFDDDWGAYLVGSDNVPLVGQGWRSYDFVVPSSSTSLPAGWATIAFGSKSPPTPDWNRLIRDVDQVVFFYGDPKFFFIFQMWNLGLDNARISFGAAARTGDTNCDGAVNFDDITPFVAAVIGRETYEAAYPGCRWLNADANGDGTVDFDDISPFVECIIAGGCV